MNDKFIFVQKESDTLQLFSRFNITSVRFETFIDLYSTLFNFGLEFFQLKLIKK